MMTGKDRSVLEINQKTLKRASHIFTHPHHQASWKLYRTRSQIALFQKVETAICDRGYYIDLIHWLIAAGIRPIT